MRIIEEDTYISTIEHKKVVKTTFKKSALAVSKWIKVGSGSSDEEAKPKSKKNPPQIKEEIHSDDNFSQKSCNNESRDNSPVRRTSHKNKSARKHSDSEGDNSPVRRTRHNNKSTRKYLDSESDNSPVRRENGKDNSPVRRGKAKEALKKEETDEINNEQFSQVSIENQSRDNSPVRRVTGFKKKTNRRNADDEDPDKKLREVQKQKELEQKYETWNKGITQINERKDALKEMEEVMKEGFARYADNEAMNKHLQKELHEEDPMAEYFTTKQQKIKMQTGVVYPTYKGQYPPNRFGIPPGYRWDGVNRSNGFETKMALAANKKKAEYGESYRSIAECAE